MCLDLKNSFSLCSTRNIAQGYFSFSSAMRPYEFDELGSLFHVKPFLRFFAWLVTGNVPRGTDAAPDLNLNGSFRTECTSLDYFVGVPTSPTRFSPTRR